jgi:hypothetical protein
MDALRALAATRTDGGRALLDLVDRMEHGELVGDDAIRALMDALSPEDADWLMKELAPEMSRVLQRKLLS